MLNIPYKLCLLLILFMFLVNFKIVHAQILLQPEIGTITSINSGTDRIVEMLREEDENLDEKIEKTNKSEATKVSEVVEVSKSSETISSIEEKSEDIEIFYPHSEINKKSDDIKKPINENVLLKSDSKNLNINHNKKTEQKIKTNNDSKTRIITAVSGGIQKVDTGNGGEIKNHISGVDIAVVRKIKNQDSKIFIGGVIDYNHNKYDNEFNSLNGSGKSDALTVGIVAKHVGNSGYYYEGSARLGRAKTDFNLNNEAYKINYDESAPVYAGHVRMGKIVKLNKKNSVDVYGSYSFSHQDRVNLKLPSNETYNLGSIDSNRLRAGCRMSTKVHNGKIYYGLGYQYEANAKIKARQNGTEIDSSSGKGNTGLLELGYKISASKNKTANVDLNATGFAGRQKGFIVQAQFIKML